MRMIQINNKEPDAVLNKIHKTIESLSGKEIEVQSEITAYMDRF